MSAVKEAVDWTLDAGLYVIINSHHDEKEQIHDWGGMNDPAAIE